ncbi:MAG: ABC transporter ATP-binding protein [Eubacteriales bacterium]|nr:ABC transporter ATP-binding protein [Eubacteriales bacterium]
MDAQVKEPIIEIRDLTKKYGDKTAVNSLNLTIDKGEVFGLLGPNGAGKTTTILMLLGLTEPTSGSAKILGMDCTREPIRVKQIVGYLPDNVGFYPDMTGRQNLAFTGRMNGLSEEQIRERTNRLLERVGMTKAADQKTGTYSRGMRQRLGVADVLMKDPQIIIMDEPTLGIDPEGMRELLELIGKLSKEDGRTLLISSHQLYQIQQVCDRVGIFVDGNLIACGGIRDLGKQIQQENHYSLEIEVKPCDDRLLAEIMGQHGIENIEKKGDRMIIHSVCDIRAQITAYLGNNGYAIQHLHQRGGDLDEIYRRYFEKAGQANENIHSHKGVGQALRFFGRKKEK